MQYLNEKGSFMSKLLKTMVFILLILGSIALAFAWMLFAKKDVILGRTRKLERTLVALGSTIEAEKPVAEATPDYPAKDISDVTSEELDTPQLSKFWDTYRSELESQDLPTLDLSKKRQELMNYYKIDPATGKPERDSLGNKITTGEGTMQSVLDEVLSKSEEQLNRLNATREQLVSVREELVATITELNKLKRKERLSLKKIDDLNSNISDMENKISALNDKIAELKEEKSGLEDQIAEQKRTIADNEDKLAESDLEIKRLKAELKKYNDLNSNTGQHVATSTTTAKGGTGTFTGQIEPGDKGVVVAVNSEWNFVIVKLNDQFMKELTSDEQAGIPQITVMVKKPGKTKEFVTKAKLIQIKKADKLGIFDMLPDWQQMPVSKGDIIFY